MVLGKRQALVVRGGWRGHHPITTTNLFIPFLSDHGFHVLVEDSLEVYEDEELLQQTDLIVQCWTGGDITRAETAGLMAAVQAGTGLAGWHGGIVDAFREDLDYQLLIGGQFVMDAEEPAQQRMRLSAEHADHPVITGIDDFDLYTRPYWTHNDPMNDVLASVTFDADERRSRPTAIPAVWTRTWGKGRVFVSTVGHDPDDLRVPEVRAITERGLLWASRWAP